MTLRYIDTQEIWRGQAINNVAHPRNIEQLWTADQLAAIGLEVVPPPEPVPPSTDPADYPLEPFQFYAMLDILGKTAQVEAAIDGIQDTTQRAVAKAKFKHSTRFHRDNELFAMLAPAVGLTDAEIDAAWMAAKDIS
jgi:hypothetical protein